MTKIDQIKDSYSRSKSLLDKVAIVYRAIFGLGICIPVLYLCGFLVGCLMLANPLEVGKATVDGVF